MTEKEKELRRALHAYDQPVRVAIKMLERTGSPTAFDIAEELRLALGKASEALSTKTPS